MNRGRTQILIRVCGLFFTGISAIVSATFILSGLGANQFVIYAFAVNIPNLLPFANLGVGTSLINNSSGRSFAKSKSFSYEKIVNHSFIILVISAGIIFISSLFLFMGGFFDSLLNLGQFRDSLIILPILAMLVIALPLSIGFFILQAEKRSTEALAIGYITPAISLIGAILASELNGIVDYWGLWVPSFGYLVACTIAFHKSKAYFRLRRSFFREKNYFEANLVKYILISGFPSLVLNSTILTTIHLPRIVFLNFGFNNEAITYSIFILFLAPLYNLISAFSLWASPLLREISQPLERHRFIQKSILTLLPFLLIISTTLILLSLPGSPKFLVDLIPLPSPEVIGYILPLTLFHSIMVFYYSSVTSITIMKIMPVRVLLLSGLLNALNWFCIKSGNGHIIYPSMTLYAVLTAFISYQYFRKRSE